MQLWWGDLDRHDAATPSPDDPLDAEERDRAARFRFEHDARRYRAAHTLLRRLLGAACALPADAVRWRLGEYGKPHLLDTGTLHFNMSHCGPHVVIALADVTPVGIDIEAGTALDEPAMAEVARRCFTDTECAALWAAGADGRRELFLRGWTRKEACLKALGSGLSIEPATFEAGLEAARRSVQIATATGVAQLTVDSVSVVAGFQVAVALLAPESLPLAT